MHQTGSCRPVSHWRCIEGNGRLRASLAACAWPAHVPLRCDLRLDESEPPAFPSARGSRKLGLQRRRCARIERDCSDRRWVPSQRSECCHWRRPPTVASAVGRGSSRPRGRRLAFAHFVTARPWHAHAEREASSHCHSARRRALSAPATGRRIVMADDGAWSASSRSKPMLGPGDMDCMHACSRLPRGPSLAKTRAPRSRGIVQGRLRAGVALIQTVGPRQDLLLLPGRSGPRQGSIKSDWRQGANALCHGSWPVTLTGVPEGGMRSHSTRLCRGCSGTALLATQHDIRGTRRRRLRSSRTRLRAWRWWRAGRPS